MKQQIVIHETCNRVLYVVLDRLINGFVKIKDKARYRYRFLSEFRE